MTDPMTALTRRQLRRSVPRLALSVRPPWPWAILHDWKDTENRSSRILREFPTRIFVHATKRPSDTFDDDARFIEGLVGREVPAVHDTGVHRYGHIVGTVTVTGLHVTEPGCCTSPWAQRHAVTHLQLADPLPLRVPILARGFLSAWTVPEPIREAAAVQIEEAA